jgi:SAM-dependent methyltransferase
MADLRYRLALRRLARGKPREYREYLRVQQQRTLSKRDNDPGAGARELVRKVVELAGLSRASSVLCVGSRNAIELGLFAAAGIGAVVGIDLVSLSPEILVMDMHDMSFEDHRFDAIYASHALEHAYSAGLVLAEFERVGRPGAVVRIEVPLGPPSSSADRLEFNSLDDLRAVVAPAVGEELWAEEQPARTPTNEQGTPVARIIFRLSAEPEAGVS